VSKASAVMVLPWISMASSRGMAMLISLVCFSSSRSSTGRVPTFLGVTLLALVADHAHDVGLTTGLIQDVAQGFPIDGETFIDSAVVYLPVLKSLVEFRGLYPDQHIA
jgi:hypothetical protein